MITIEQLSEGGLGGFSIQELIEVYKVDADGRKSVSAGYYKSVDVATDFAQNQTDADYYKTK